MITPPMGVGRLVGTLAVFCAVVILWRQFSQTATTLNTPVVKGNLRILAVGDSITDGYGSSDKNGYRLQLRTMLVDKGYAVNFVGSQQSGDANIDLRHEGWGGCKIRQIGINIALHNGMQRHPNLVILQAGTNDVRPVQPPTELESYQGTPERLGTLIDMLSCECPDAIVLVGQISKIRDSGDNEAGAQARADAFNAALPGVVKERVDRGHMVALVDNSDIGGALLPDGLHPSDEGYRIMAQNWFAAIENLPVPWRKKFRSWASKDVIGDICAQNISHWFPRIPEDLLYPGDPPALPAGLDALGNTN